MAHKNPFPEFASRSAGLFCPVFRECGACELPGLPYQAQLRSKLQSVVSTLGHLRPGRICPVLGMENPYHYRHKVQLPFGMRKGAAVLGCFDGDTRLVVDRDECLLEERSLSRICCIARDWVQRNRYPVYSKQSGKGVLRHILLRKAFGTGEIVVCFVTNGNLFPGGRNLVRHILDSFDGNAMENNGRIVGFVQNMNSHKTNVVLGTRSRTVWGRPYVRENLGKYIFHVSVESFFQVNPSQAIRIFDKTREFAGLTGNETVVDAYAGTGTIAVWLAFAAGQVLAVEENRQAVADGRKNCSLNKTKNIRFLGQDATDALREIKSADVLVLDPPRKGCGTQVCRSILRLLPNRVVYVSCNPATFASDAQVLCNKYVLAEVQPVDLFPHTPHVELVARFELR